MNYIITSTFIGEAIELLRLADLVFYIYMIITAKSTAERNVIRHVGISFNDILLLIEIDLRLFNFHFVSECNMLGHQLYFVLFLPIR